MVTHHTAPQNFGHKIGSYSLESETAVFYEPRFRFMIRNQKKIVLQKCADFLALAFVQALACRLEVDVVIKRKSIV